MFSIKKCSALENDSYFRCNTHILSALPNTIFFCLEHGNLIFSPTHSVIYGKLHFLPKLEANKYFRSKIYNESLTNSRYLKILTKILYKNFEKLDINILLMILSFLKKY